MTRLLSLALLLGAASLCNAAECEYCGRENCQVTHWYRAGKPTCVHRFAIPSDTGKYSGGIVGGGALVHGDEPYVEEGTWGWDYLGFVPVKRVWLGWSHKHYQAGGGKYDTDHRKRR
jgi:hypothetical protein